MALGVRYPDGRKATTLDRHRWECNESPPDGRCCRGGPVAAGSGAVPAGVAARAENQPALALGSTYGGRDWPTWR